MKKLAVFAILIICAAAVWFAADYILFRNDYLALSDFSEAATLAMQTAADHSPEARRADALQQLPRADIGDFFRPHWENNMRLWIGQELNRSGLRPSDEMINLLMEVSAELGMTSYDEIAMQIRLAADTINNPDGLRALIENAEGSDVIADELIVEDVVASFEPIKKAFPSTAFLFESTIDSEDVEKLAVLYAVIYEDMDLTFEEMQFFWRVTILAPVLIGTANRTAPES